jgi:hypothetical protein
MEHVNFSEIFNWLSLHSLVVWPLLSLMVLTVVVMKWWEKVRYFMLNLRYGFPWVGRVASAARKPQSPDVSYRGITWYASERMVCADYHPYYRNLDDRCDPVFFERCEDYLSKTGQLGRKEKGVLLWLATFALVIFEAVGFAYVLAPFMARNVSANTAGMLAWMIAFMLSIILVPLTDKMGQQLHKNTLLKKIRVWHADARKNGTAEKLEPNTRIKIDTTHEDDDKPNYIKILNRIDAEARPTPGWKISFITILVIAAIAIGAYVIRSHTLDGLETEQVNASPFAAMTAGSASATPFDLPGAAKVDNAKADERAASERVEAQIVAYKTTFVILSVIFVGVQVFGILFGFFYSLAGEESAKAARYIRGFNNSREFSNHYQALRDKVARDAQSRLATLQALVEERHDTSGSEQAGRVRASFPLYLQEKRDQAMLEAGQQPMAVNTGATPVEAAVQAVPPVPLAAVAAPAVPAVAEPSAPVPAPATVDAAPAHVSPAVDETGVISGLGDLTGWADDELADMAAELGLSLERLQRKQRMQKQIAQARHVQQSTSAGT